MRYFVGIDVGSVTTKAVLLVDNTILSSHLIPSGGSYREAAKKVVEEILAKRGLSLKDITSIVATGYGAANVPFSNRKSSEISCQGKGVNYLFPKVRTVIDIGGQASRVIKVDEQGGVRNFMVNEKCAAGSGEFLQVIARVLGIELDDIGPLSLKAKNSVTFTTGCAVFAESETISRITEGALKEDILAGIHAAMASKIQSLLERVKLEHDCALTGGGAKDIGLIKSVEQKIGISLLIPPEPQLTAALGAALLARQNWKAEFSA
jgi:predicted CoA-substrate-specific enzyme activase